MPSADGGEDVDGAGGGVAREDDGFRHRRGSVPCGMWSRIAFFTRSPCGSTRMNGTPSTAFGDQSRKMSRSASASSRTNTPRVLTTVATLRMSSGRYLPRAARSSSRFTSSSRVTCFSKPSGMSDFGDSTSSSMSSRSTTCFLPSGSYSSSAVLVSEAKRPVSTRPSLVAIRTRGSSLRPGG